MQEIYYTLKDQVMQEVYYLKNEIFELGVRGGVDVPFYVTV